MISEPVTDLDFMNRALHLAAAGRGCVEPNPLVGAVVVRDGRIVGEGWHERYGQAHAEVNALNRAGEAARGATLYVTLEPCCHHGKTPPCTGAVLRAGVRRVVAAMLDPFPQVAGEGARVLREAGVDVEIGIGGPAAQILNAPYLTLLRAGRPWIHGKWAMTLDGKIASFARSSQWITGEAARRRVHEVRGRMDAVLVGSGTLRADDPLLTARPPGPRRAARIVVASGDEALPEDCRLLQTLDQAPVIVVVPTDKACCFDRWASRGAEIVGLQAAADGRLDIADLLAELGRRRMTNVMVEGGSGTLGAFLDARLIDEVHAYIAPKLLGGERALSPIGGRGIEKMPDALTLSLCEYEQLGEDLLVHGYVAK